MSSTWRTAYTNDYGDPSADSYYSSVSAASASSAWAVGGREGGAQWLPVAVHWQGSAWQETRMPAGLEGPLSVVSADSESDAWAVCADGSCALHWDGTGWTVARRWPPSGPSSSATVIAFGPADVWVFGAGPDQGTWHLRGVRWTRVAPPGPGVRVTFASAPSPDDLWAVAQGPVYQHIVHYQHGRWTQSASPATEHEIFNSILALSDRDIWATAFGHRHPGRPQFLPGYLVHRGPGGWVRQALPWHNLFVGTLAPDGHGGLWISASNGSGNYLLHRSAAGHWSRVFTGSTGGGSITGIPGTTALWGAGARDYQLGEEVHRKAVILGYGILRTGYHRRVRLP